MKVHYKVKEHMIIYTPNSVCIIQLHSQELWKYIWHLCQDMKVSYLCFQFSRGGFTMRIIIIHLVYIYFFSIQYYKSQPIKACKSSLYKKQQQIHIDDPFHPKAPYCKGFHGTLFREYHRTRSTPTQTHTEAVTWTYGNAPHVFTQANKQKQNKNALYRSLIAMRLLKHVFNQFFFFFLPKTLRHDPPLTSY